MSNPFDAVLLPQPIWDTEIATCPETARDWVFPGFLARGNVTLLTSLWKAGKTTFLAHLLARRSSGQPLLDRRLEPGKSVILSEEPRALWADRCRRFPFGGNVCLFPQPFPRLPSALEWSALLERIAGLRERHGIDLLIVDSLAHFLRGESNSQCVLETLAPLRALAARGVAVLITHHPRRRDTRAGSAARGHGAIQSEVDISIEMRHAGDNLDSRARRFFCLSRHADTPRHLLFELNADGNDYTLLPDLDDAGFSEQWLTLRMVLEDAPQKLTRLDLLDEWPEDHSKPDEGTLRRWLDQALAAKLILIEGAGRKTDPFRYWLPEAEARWREDPFYAIFEEQRRVLQHPFESLRDRNRRLAQNDKVDWDAPLPRGVKLWPPGSEEE